ncbi:MAG: Glycosyl transferase, family 2 [candidate division WWE3 bacterium GW2011_GWB1_44_4]|uniref:Glycosyl transferase, family 2 n=1 Tax=candidate division WWE3 bacterium GW2011_GWB1_44_4 TaxID=1619116 RepID=A0A0G1JDL6_UNCKA|nr:MAG: Glycosyl transferase, family 2 [candidate division WWE3 bacterium GW2011_GWB1_44_4]
MKVSIIVPIYKQEKTIKKDLENIAHVMSQTRWDFELIGVVDGSPDNSFEEAKKLKDPHIKIYGYEHNKGKGYAIRNGMARASGEYISFIDAGMDIDPNGISMLLEHMEWYDADIIVGSKKHPASQINYHVIRQLYSCIYHLLVRILFGLKLKDTQTGLKVFKRNVMEKVLPRLLVKQFALDVEILAVAKKLGFDRIYEAPVKINLDEGNSSFSLFPLFDKGIQKMVIDTLAIFYRLNILGYYNDASKRKWIYDKDLDMRVNTGELG